MNRTICVHQLPEIDASMLPDSMVAQTTTSREGLRSTLTMFDISLVILDLDQPDAQDTIVEALELKPTLGIVGVTIGSNLSAVIAAQRAGCGQVVTKPIDPDDLATAVRQTLDLGGASGTEHQTMALIGASGGVGTTTIACNLAVELAVLTESHTALIDMDLEFGGVARAFDLSPHFTFSELAGAGAIDPMLLDKAMVKLPSGAHIIARPPTIYAAHSIDETAACSVIKAASRVYRRVLLDLPRRLDPVTGCAIDLCDKLLIVTQLTVSSIDNASRLIEALAREGFLQDRIEIVVNRYRKNVHACTVELLEEQLAHKVFAVVPSDYASVNKAIDTGRPLAQRNPVRTAIAEMAQRLAGEGGPTTRSGWFQSLGLGRRHTATAR